MSSRNAVYRLVGNIHTSLYIPTQGDFTQRYFLFGIFQFCRKDGRIDLIFSVDSRTYTRVVIKRMHAHHPHMRVYILNTHPCATTYTHSITLTCDPLFIEQVGTCIGIKWAESGCFRAETGRYKRLPQNASCALYSNTRTHMHPYGPKFRTTRRIECVPIRACAYVCSIPSRDACTCIPFP